MAKSMVEKYEQILAQDPASTVFVELAKALIEAGSHEQAIKVCQAGLAHHADSVVGRVLWGKALINMGRPAEAMEQFDLAVAIDKENPHAYNLIGEVLLHKGLYRSALPLLKKAVALQPNDGRVRQWLEQTQRVLAGGPAPILRDSTDVESIPTDPAMAARGGPIDADRTDVGVPALQESDPNDPFGQVPKRTSSSDTIRGITSTFDALAEGAQDAGPPGPAPAPARAAAPPAGQRPSSSRRPITEPTIIPSADLMQDAHRDKTDPGDAEGGGLLGDLGPPPQTGEEVIPPPAPRASARAPQNRALLADLPEMPEPASQLDVPKVEFSSTATQAIAQEYERELRAKLAAQAQRKTFLQRHGAKLAILAVLVVAGAVGVVAWRFTLAKHGGLDLNGALARAKVGVTQDTGRSLKAALDALKEAQAMDDRVPEVWALQAYAHALLYAEHGGGNTERAAASAALGQPGVSEGFPGLTLAAAYYASEPKDKPAAGKAVIDSAVDQPMIHELAGRLLFAKKDVKGALDRLRRATEESPSVSDVRAYVLLGDYYRESGDFANAADKYARAVKISGQHPVAVVGNAEAAIEQQADLSDVAKALDELKPAEDWPPGLADRRDLVLGRVLSAVGRHDEAIQLLTQGVQKHHGSAFAFDLALGDADRAAGRMGDAQKAYEAALALSKRDEAKEGLGRALIARDREREVLTRIPAEPESRRVSLVRGMAYAHLADWKHARAELSHTQTNGKYPPEAVISLALADAAEGQADRAQTVLEKTLAAAKKAKGEVRVALGKVYWDRGALDKARAQFEEAAKEPSDYEGGCSLGRLLLHLGLPDVAQKPLAASVEHNASHGEARHALGQALILLGKPEEAVKVFQGWLDENPSAAANRDLAWGLWAVGRAKEADAPINRALKLDPNDYAAHRVHAQVLFATGDGKNGFKALERANKLNTKDPETFCEIGRAFLRQDYGDRAAAAFQAVKRESPESGCGIIGPYLAALPANGRQAEKDLTQVAGSSSSVPDKGWAQATLARFFLAAGRVKEARKAAEAAVGLCPHSGDAQLALGLVAQRQKDEAKAREALTQAALLEPAHALAQLALGDVLSRGGEADAPAALAAYESYLRVGGNLTETERVKRTLTNLKKKVASR